MENDPAFQLLARSASFLTAAKVCVENGGNRPLLRAPILHLVAHGLEVLFKHVQVLGGKSPDEVRKEFGHNIKELWEHELAKEMQRFAKLKAEEAFEIAKESGKFKGKFGDDPFDLLDDPFDLLKEYIDEISKLHSKETEFALRYIQEPNLEGPRPLLLIDTFLPVKDEFMRRLTRK